MQTSVNHVRAAHRAFSLVEMMVVLLILAVVLAIVVPALSAARNTARKAATNAMLNQLGTSCAQFQMDERRLPGYFTARDMGNAQNGTQYGFSAMNNIMLDLAGGIVPESWPADGPPPGGFSFPERPRRVFHVGPHNGAQVKIDTGLIGSSQQIKGVTIKAYFQPDPKYFAVVTGKFGDVDPSVDDEAIPDLIDAWGTPILAWQKDDVPSTGEEFATLDSASPSKFYWVQNAAFLKATNLAKAGVNQAAESLIGSATSPSSRQLESFWAILGAPAFPDPRYPDPDPNFPDEFLRPLVERSPIVFQSGGYNSVFVGRDERGGIMTRPTGGNGAIKYRSKRDAMEQFDDVLAKVTN